MSLSKFPINAPKLDKETKDIVSQVYHDTDSVKVTVDPSFLMKNKMNKEYGMFVTGSHGWQKLPDHLLALTVQEFQEVMDDGLANGFEFRLQGSTILYREVHS